jgi:SAM-dependent methyltransferase
MEWARGAWRIARRELSHRFGLGDVPSSADRRWLERQWLPALAARADVRTVLFVGVRWYTRDYPARVPGKRFVTLDIDPRAARHGNAGEHLIGDVCDVARLVPAGSVDSAVFNGVFGWGLDAPDALARALDGLAGVLRPRGELLFGWNDVPRHRPFDPFDPQRVAAWRERFEPLASPLLGGACRLELATDNHHCFALFAKRD